jgi:TPR repeat protein
MRTVVILLSLLCSSWFSPVSASDSSIDPRSESPSSLSREPTPFNEAQRAASEGRYEDVVTILTAVIDARGLSGNASGLSSDELAIAHSNRGIAYSLEKNYALAIQDLQQAITLNPEHLLTLNHLGILAEHVEGNFAVAASWYAKAATLGYAASQVNLGNLFRDGRGVEKDYAKAVQLYQLAVEQNYEVGLVALGEMYIQGAGVPRDEATGLALLRQGVAKGVVTGHYYLGIAYEKGRGVPQSFDTALDHYRTSAMQGHAPSQGALGYMYRRGHSVDKDFMEAVKWYRLAAEQGDAKAANRLSWLLATCPTADVCNGRVALEFAGLAVQSDRSATNLDSLAAAYARTGEFDRALQVVREILNDESLSDIALKKYRRRIERYQNGIPFQL